MRKFLTLFMVLILLCSAVFAQNRTISGKISDEKGEPVPFATVKVKDSKKGTAADAGGLFTIEISKTGDVTLVISSQGFEVKEVSVTGNGFQEISLKSTGQLQEVVVTTALGIKRSKNKLPYAAQIVTGDDASRSRSANFINNLSGRVAGLDIKQSNTLGGSTNVVLRGNKTISGNNQALFVVDGVPYDNTAIATPNQRAGRGGYDYGNAAADINPDDIESITVLKGPAASALYGSRGFNGVILVTTKKVSKGLGVTVNSGVTFVSTDKKTFPKYQQEYGGGYGTYYEDPTGYFLYRDPNSGFAPAYVTDANGNIVNWFPSGRLVYTSSEDASYGGKFDPNLLVYQADAFDPTSPNFGKATPWLPAKNQPWTFLEKPINFNNSIFIDGGSDKATFKLGYTRNDDKGILPNSKITKDQLSFGGTLNLNSKLTASTNLNYTKTSGLGRYATGYSDPGNPFGGFRQWWQTNTDILQQKNAYFNSGKNITWNWADPTDLTPIYWDNLYFNRYENYETDQRNRYFGNLTLNYKATDWLNFMGRISIDQYDEIQEERTAIGSLNPSGYVRNNRNRKEINYDFLASFDKNLTTDINLKAIAGVNIRTEQLATINSTTNGGLVVPKLYAVSNSKNPIGFPTEF
ncbi:MAG: TonB-dependent receptor plug domain-containing protein, partial [Sphingobacteriales bacterium]